MLLNYIKKTTIIFVIICMSVSCTDINKVYNKKFNFYSFYEDLTIIENSGLLRTEDAQLLKTFIDRKILNDSIYWLKTKSYKELFFFATDDAKNGSSSSVFDLSWKTNNSLHISFSSYDADKGDAFLKIENISENNIRYFRALLKFETNFREKIGQIDFIFNDTISVNSQRIIKYNDKVIYLFKGMNRNEIVLIPIIRKVVFSDSTEYVNPLSSYFD